MQVDLGLWKKQRILLAFITVIVALYLPGAIEFWYFRRSVAGIKLDFSTVWLDNVEVVYGRYPNSVSYRAVWVLMGPKQHIRLIAESIVSQAGDAGLEAAMSSPFLLKPLHQRVWVLDEPTLIVEIGYSRNGRFYEVPLWLE